MNNGGVPYSIALPSGALLAVDLIDNLVGVDLARPISLSESTSRRQREKDAWRALARMLLGDPTAQFSYSSIGAPLIEASHLNISVSHSATLVAVIISAEPCAVDVERLDRNFVGVASRYISPSEQPLLALSSHAHALLWSAKEALYKYAGRKSLELLSDIRVLSLTPRADDFIFAATIAPHEHKISGTATFVSHHSLVYIG